MAQTERNAAVWSLLRRAAAPDFAGRIVGIDAESAGWDYPASPAAVLEEPDR